MRNDTYYVLFYVLYDWLVPYDSAPHVRRAYATTPRLPSFCKKTSKASPRNRVERMRGVVALRAHRRTVGGTIPI